SATPRTARRHDVRRRAGDGFDRPRLDGGAAAAARRRAVARVIALVGEGELRHLAQHPRARDLGVPRRAERAPDAGHRRSWLRALEGARGRERQRGRAGERPASDAGVLRRREGEAMIDAIELTRKLIAIDSINPTSTERGCAELVGSLLEDAG